MSFSRTHSDKPKQKKIKKKHDFKLLLQQQEPESLEQVDLQSSTRYTPHPEKEMTSQYSIVTSFHPQSEDIRSQYAMYAPSCFVNQGDGSKFTFMQHLTDDSFQ